MDLKVPKIDIGILKQKKKPLHIAIDGSRLTKYIEKKELDLKDAAKKNVEQIRKFMHYQVKNSIPILTLNISAESEEEVNELVGFFEGLMDGEGLRKNNTRVFIIGNWFDLDQRLTDTFKQVMEQTNEFDKFFLNFCVKYDGQEEVLGVIKLLAKKAALGKVKLEELDKEQVKENLYTSYFTPPEIIIEPSKTYSGLLLWDSKGSKIYQTRKNWLELDNSDIDQAIEWANRE